jgi:uncharacterized protein (UPF0261 family)
MTTSRYVITLLFDGKVFMSDDNWDKFKKSIFTGCTFKVDMTQNNQKGWTMCKFNSRYYFSHNDTIKNYHVTNDDRRQIARFIRKHHST